MPQTEVIGVPINSYPVDARLQDRRRGTDMPPHQGWLFGIKRRAGAAGGRAAPVGYCAAPTAAPAQRGACWPGPAPRPAGRASVHDNRPPPPVRPTPPAAIAACPPRFLREPEIR